MNEHINPGSLMVPEGNSYTQIVTSTGNKTIHIAGQVSVDSNGNVLHEGDLGAQARQALENIRLALEAVGAEKKDLVRLRYYIVNYSSESIPVLMAALEDFFGDIPAPAGTLLGISALFLPGMMIEIDGTAVL